MNKEIRTKCPLCGKEIMHLGRWKYDPVGWENAYRCLDCNPIFAWGEHELKQIEMEKTHANN
jgi:DNA-directed RNA polymerase subunit RPC12/RpoP